MMTGPVGGIDPHQHQFTVGVVDPNGVEIAHRTFPNKRHLANRVIRRMWRDEQARTAAVITAA